MLRNPIVWNKSQAAPKNGGPAGANALVHSSPRILTRLVCDTGKDAFQKKSEQYTYLHWKKYIKGR